MNAPREYAAASIGAWAYSTWTQSQTATVIGVTSRGLFLRAAPNRVLFLSIESQRGPLTITLPPSLRAQFTKQSPHTGDVARFSANRLLFPTIEVSLSVSQDAVWRPAQPATSTRSPEAIRHTLRSIAEAVTARCAEGFSPLLLPLLDRSAPPPDDQVTLFATLTSLRALCAKQSPAAAEYAIDLLGYGRGLTPSGDDGVIGLLLMLNRWQTQPSLLGAPVGLRGAHPSTALRSAQDATKQSPASRWSDFNQRVIEAAYQKTTTISANLIECAAAGQADERLINVVDGIITGTPSIDECTNCVLDWGNSSGIDALVGMAIAVSVDH